MRPPEESTWRVLVPFDVREGIDLSGAAKRAGKSQTTIRKWCNHNEGLIDGLDITAPRRREAVIQFHALDGRQTYACFLRQLNNRRSARVGMAAAIETPRNTIHRQAPAIATTTINNAQGAR